MINVIITTTGVLTSPLSFCLTLSTTWRVLLMVRLYLTVLLTAALHLGHSSSLTAPCSTWTSTHWSMDSTGMMWPQSASWMNRSSGSQGKSKSSVSWWNCSL